MFATDSGFAGGMRYRSREIADDPNIAGDLAIADDRENAEDPEIPCT